MLKKSIHNPHSKAYGVLDLFDEINQGIPFPDYISRIHLLTGYDRYALKLLRLSIEKRYGKDIVAYANFVHANGPKVETPAKCKQGKMVVAPRFEIAFVIGFIDYKLGSNRKGPSWFLNSLIHEKYSHHEIALICHYNEERITKDNAQSIAERYGHRSGKAYQHFNKLRNSRNRIAWIKESEDNKESFKRIEKELTPEGRELWMDEYKSIFHKDPPK